MSLRVRIGLSAAAAVAVAVLLVAATTYAATARRLERAVDADLDRAATAVLALASADEPLARRLADFRGLGDGDGDGDGDGRGRGRPGPGRADPDRFLGPLDVGIVQLVRPDQHVETVGPARLPVDDATIALARTGGEPVRSTVQVEGATVRVLAVPAGALGALQLGAPIDDIARSLEALRGQLLLAGLLGAALAGALGAAVADRAVRPVRRLTLAAEDVSRTGDLTTRIDVGAGTDELARLAGSFNGMLSSLEAARASQQQLVADASHELRTPLTSLRTNIEVLQLGGQLAADEQAALLSDVTAQLGEFGRLVDGLVELARGDGPARAPTRIILGELVAEAVDRLAVLAPDVPVTLTVDDGIVVAERDRLDRAVSNLLENAVKHGGATAIEVTVEQGSIRVRDHGPGIADDDAPHVFDRFYRAPDARSRPGSGLGLSIVAQVADAHGGTYSARSHPDGGAEVELRLPSV